MWREAWMSKRPGRENTDSARTVLLNKHLLKVKLLLHCDLLLGSAKGLYTGQTPPPSCLKCCINAASVCQQQCLKANWQPNMKGLSLVLLVLLLMLATAAGEDPEMQYWTCGYRGLCRRFCYAQEYIIGHHGCPRRYRCCAVRS
ncbi:beta-defensin-like 2 [Anableps anableps]